MKAETHLLSYSSQRPFVLSVASSIGPYLFAAFVTACAFKIFIIHFHLPNIDALTAAARGVIEGKPHWLAYQNRLLGPYAILAISKLNVTYATAWSSYTFVMLVFQGLLLFHLSRRLTGSNFAAINALIFFLFFFLILQNYWFYPWDSIDLMIFTVFAYAIITEKTIMFYVPLFFIGILNRESALFIALFICIDAFKFNLASASIRLVNSSKLLLGGLLLGAGIVYTHIVRHALFISKSDGQPDTEHELIGNHIMLAVNVRDILYNNFFDRNIIYSVAVLIAVLYFGLRVKSLKDSEFKAYFMFIIILTNILIFGWFNETRMLFILLPFVLFLTISIHMKSKCDGN